MENYLKVIENYLKIIENYLKVIEKDCREYFWKLKERSIEKGICIMEEGNQFLLESKG